MSEAAQDLLCERSVRRTFYEFINLSKFFAIFYRKQTYKGGHV